MICGYWFRSRYRGPAGMTHHFDSVLLRPTNLGLAVIGIFEVAEAELRQPYALLRHFFEIFLRECRLDNDCPRMDLHAVGPEIEKAGACRNRQTFYPCGILRPTWSMDLAGGDDAGDAAVRIGFEKTDRPLSRRVITQDNVAMRIDQAGNDRRSLCVHDHIGFGYVQTFTDVRDYAAIAENRVSIYDTCLQIARHQC